VRLSVASVVSAQSPADDDRERAWFFSAGVRGSAAEHAAVEQLRPVPAISTIQALNLACEEGQRIYYITSANWGAVRPLLGHPSYILDWIDADISGGWHIVIHEDPITYGEWSGTGWITFDPDSGSAGYLISGYIASSVQQPLIVSGGSGVKPEPGLETPNGRHEDNENVAYLGALRGRDRDPDRDPASEGATPDPVDTANGAFVHRHQDLASLGGLGIPLGLERFYASSQNSLSSALGYGWSHSYDTRFYTSTHWSRVLAGRTALEAAPALAAAQVGVDLFDAATIPHQRFSMDVTIAHWLMAQITDNAVTLIGPDGTVSTHVRLSDGAYQPPAGEGNLDTVTIIEGESATLDWEDGTSTYFDAQGRPTALDDANGNRTTFSYDIQGRLSQITDAVERSLTLTYDTQGRLTQVSDPAGRTLGYSYDAQGNLQTYTDPRGEVTTYTYDDDHRLASVTDALDTTYVTNQYDALGRVVTQFNGRGGQTSLLYGGDHTIVTDPMGYRSTYFYDERLRLLGIQDALGNRTTVSYDAADHEVARTNPLNQTTFLGYDAWGHLTIITDALGYVVTWTYDLAGNPVSYTDQRDKTWQLAYDGQHNLTAVTDPLGNVTLYTYDDQGQLTQAQDPAGVYVTYTYDECGNPDSLTNALGEASDWDYDVVGRPTSFTDGTAHTTQFSYDTSDNLLQITDPLGHQVGYTYDANGNLVEFTNANGYTTTFAYDAQFNLVGVTDALGESTTYDYDANDHLVRITDANDHQTVYQRDPVGQLITTTDPLNRDLVFDYDAAGRLLTFDRADGGRISYQHDALGRMTGIDYPTGPDVSYVYDAAGNMTQAAYDGGWSASYVYDDAGRLATVQDAGRNLTFSYQYDLAGRRTGLRVSRDTTILYDLAYAYDAAARLSALTDQTGSPTAAVGLAYDAAGRMTRITDPGSAYADYVYDAAGRLTQVSHRDGEGANVATYAYTYDPAGNPTAVTETTPLGVFGVAYAYDALDRLTTETYPRYAIEYTFDAVGNLTRRLDPMGTLDYTYDDADQLQSRGGESFTHDQNGNLITWQNARGAYTYTYDYDNRLTSLTLPDGTATTFAYDVFDRRLTAQGPMGDQGFVHDGLDIILRGDNDLEQALERYLYGNGLLVGGHTDSLGFTAYRGDALENVRYLLDDRGRVFDAFRYNAFGRPARQAGINPTPFRFVGQRGVYRHDGLAWPVLLMGYRYYDPGSGRFLTRDPWPGNLLHPISLNDYDYAFSNPIRYNDPSGLRPPEFEDPPSGVQEASWRPNPPDYSPDERTDFPALEEPPTPDLPMPGVPGPEVAGASTSGGARRASQLPTGSSGESEFDPATQGADVVSWQLIEGRGSAYALACTEDSLLAGAFHAGLLRSTDTGHVDWNAAYLAGVGEIAVVDANTCYAGAWHDGALKSSNGGLSWAPINDGLIADDVYALVADPASPNHLFAGTEMGLYVSHDGGENWGRPTGTLPGRLVFDLAFAGDVLLAVTDLGLYRSDDGGASWQAPTDNLLAVSINVLLVGSPSTTVYAGTALGPYQSLDSGDTWASWGTGLESERVHALAVDPADANHVVAGTTAGLFVSTNSGDTWAGDTNAGLKGIASQVGAVAFCPDGGDASLYLGAGGGVYALRTFVPPGSVTISGPVTGAVQINYTFTATVDPGSATLPITYVWEATDQGVTTYPEIGSLNHTKDFTWSTTGTKIITVGASSVGEPVTDVYTIVITGGVPPAAVTITGPITGFIQTGYTFTATASPPTTMLPISFAWQVSDQDSVTHADVHSLSDTATFNWNTAGTKTVTVTASNASGPAVTGVHTIVISMDAYRVYLPLVVKHWPPVPFAPNLLSIDNSDQDGNYTVRWAAPAGPGVTAYELEEDGVIIASDHTSTSYPVSGQSPGTHTYRVRGKNSYGSGFWSNSQSVFVMPPSTFMSVADTFVLQGYASMNLGSESEMWAGYDDYLDPDGRIARSFVKFDLSEIPAGMSIAQATLHLRLYNSWDYPGRSRTITTYRLGSTWSEMTVNWNSQPSIAEAYGSTPVTHGSERWYTFDVTVLVRGWVNHTWPNHGLAVRGPEHSGSDSSWKSFYTRESSYDPYLSITYTSQGMTE
jgi:RHS repeat-associated protein